MLIDKIKELKKVQDKISDLAVKKSELAKEIAKLEGHNMDGQKSYNEGKYTITIKTPSRIKINKSVYLEVASLLPPEYKCVQEEVETKYKVDKAHYRKILEFAEADVIEDMAKYLTEERSDPSVTINSRKK